MDTELLARLKPEALVSLPNICTELADEDLARIGTICKQEFQVDLLSRSEWEESMAKIMEMAMQIVKEKSFPWPNAANVKFPILSIAAIQYAARAYPALVTTNDIVRYQVFGDDPKGEKDKQGQRIGKHMTYQLTEEDTKWEEGTDRALLIQPLVGCAFKKVYFDPLRKKNRSDLVFPRNLVINYYSKDLDSAPRLSHIIPLQPNDVKERERKGFFREAAEADKGGKPGSPPQMDRLTEVKDQSQGVRPPPSDAWATPNDYVEQCRGLDLDGDGYAEPYAVTFHRETGRVVRIIARFSTKGIERNAKKQVAYIEPINYYEKYPFVPSPDGGIYDIGFGHLLYPISETVNTSINQLLDSATLKTLGGGFLGRGAKFKSGNSMFQPGEWKQVDSTGDDLRKSIFPLPVGEPSAVMFNLLNLLVQYAERLSSAVDQMVGQTPDQNTPAETSRNSLAEGMRVFSAIVKRTYRSMKGEFQKLYKLNQLYLPDQPTGPFKITCKDYEADPLGIRPAADPNVMSEGMRYQRDLTVYQMGQTDPGVNRYEAGRRLLEGMRVSAIEAVYPDPKGPNAIPPPSPSSEQITAEAKMKQVEVRELDTQAKHKLGAAKLMIQAQESGAKVMKLQAEAMAIQREAMAGPDTDLKKAAEREHRLKVIDMELKVSRAKHDALMGAIDTLHNVVSTEREHDLARRQQELDARNPEGAGAPGE